MAIYLSDFRKNKSNACLIQEKVKPDNLRITSRCTSDGLLAFIFEGHVLIVI